MAAVFETLPRYSDSIVPTIGRNANVLCNNEYIGTLCGRPIVKTDNIDSDRDGDIIDPKGITVNEGINWIAPKNPNMWIYIRWDVVSTERNEQGYFKKKVLFETKFDRKVDINDVHELKKVLMTPGTIYGTRPVSVVISEVQADWRTVSGEFIYESDPATAKELLGGYQIPSKYKDEVFKALEKGNGVLSTSPYKEMSFVSVPSNPSTVTSDDLIKSTDDLVDADRREQDEIVEDLDNRLHNSKDITGDWNLM